MVFPEFQVSCFIAWFTLVCFLFSCCHLLDVLFCLCYIYCAVNTFGFVVFRRFSCFRYAFNAYDWGFLVLLTVFCWCFQVLCPWCFLCCVFGNRRSFARA